MLPSERTSARLLFILFLCASTSLLHAQPRSPPAANSDIDGAFNSYDSADLLDDYDNADEAQRELHHHHPKVKIHKVPPPPPLRAAPPPIMQTGVHTELFCSPGFTLVDGRCVRNDIVPGDYVCPPGFQKVGPQECAQYSPGRRECPPGFRLSGLRCIVTDIVPSELICEEGVLDPTGTVCKITGPSGLRCPPGSVMSANGRECSEAFPAAKACPDGHVLHRHGLCLRTVSAVPTPVCPQGHRMEVDGKKCFAMRPKGPKCMHGFRMSHDGVKCLKKVQKMLAPCPAGFTEFSRHKAVCERMIEIPPHLTCPPEYLLNPSTGQCEMHSVAVATCPGGYSPSATLPHTCEQIVPQEPTCPPGTIPIRFGPTMRCQRSVDHPLIECCSPGFVLTEGRCERTEVFPATVGCKGECERVLATRPQYYCPDGYDLSGAYCKSRTSQQCTPPAMPAECESYMPHASLRSAKADLDQIPANCISVVIAQRTEVCDVPQLIPAQFSCPDPHAALENGFCVVRQMIVEVDQFCRVGLLDAVTNRCVKTTRVPIKTECPPGTTRLGLRCVSYENVQPLLSCPADTILGTAPNTCVRTCPASMPPVGESRVASAVPVCPSGNLQGALCFDVERIPRHWICPPNSVPAGNHHNDAALMFGVADQNRYCMQAAEFVIAPAHKRYSRPKFYCPDGTLARGRHCFTHKKIPPAISCPPGTTQNKELCVRILPPVPTNGRMTTVLPSPFCPPGTVIQGNKCLTTREAPPMVTCPPPFQMEPIGAAPGRECVIFAPMSMLCPPGTEQTANGCIRSMVLPPTVTTVENSVCEVGSIC